MGELPSIVLPQWAPGVDRYMQTLEKGDNVWQSHGQMDQETSLALQILVVQTGRNFRILTLFYQTADESLSFVPFFLRDRFVNRLWSDLECSPGPSSTGLRGGAAFSCRVLNA